MRINISSGHNPDGKIACGAVGLIKESTEARLIKNKVMSMLQSLGHIVYDCTVDNGTSQNDVLKKIVAKCNAHKVDLDVSIHFNAGASKLFNKKTTGTEVLVYSSTSKAKPYAQNIVNSIASLGFKNRGVKYSKTLYFLRKTNSPSLLIECCFVDDPDDVNLYNVDKMAQAIVKGITGIAVAAPTNSIQPTTPSSFVHNGLDYSKVFDPAYYANKYADLKIAFGYDSTSLFNHFIQCGITEGRQAISTFSVLSYKNNYKDLRDAFGNNLPKYVEHYIALGIKEGRKGI